MSIDKSTDTAMNQNDLKILRQNKKKLFASEVMINACIVYSMGTEIVFFCMSIAALVPSFPFWLVLIISFLLSSIIELGGISFLESAIDDKIYGRDKADKLGWYFIVGLCVICYGVSSSVSIGGLPTVYRAFNPAPELSTTVFIDSTLNKEKSFIASNYGSDVSLVQSNFDNVIRSIEKEYSSKIEIEKGKIKKHKRDLKNGNEWAKGWVDKRTATINKLEAERDVKISSQQNLKGQELATLLGKKNKYLESTKELYDTEKAGILEGNKTKSDNYISNKENTILWMRFGVLIIIPIIFFCSLITRRIYKRANYVPPVSPVDDSINRLPVLKRFYNLIRDQISVRISNVLDGWEVKKPKPKYQQKEILYHIRNDKTVINNPIELDDAQKNLDAFTASVSIQKDVKNLDKKTFKNLDKKTLVLDRKKNVISPPEKVAKDVRKKTLFEKTFSHPRQSVVSERGEKIAKKKCECFGCKKTFKLKPKNKRFCSSKCRVKHHNFNLKK